VRGKEEPVIESILLLTFVLVASQQVPGPVQPVSDLDLDRYSGRWYEVARFPNRFQADCVGETTAVYDRMPNGEIRVVNECGVSDGGVKRAEGRARLADRDGPASVLEVRFAPGWLSFLPMVWGDYWVLDLTPDYGAALVGDPSREYLWILSRTPVLEAETYARMVATAAAQGFAVERLMQSPAQVEGSPPSSPPPGG
jgi:apolipoprotein D and lipocalin family protein